MTSVLIATLGAEAQVISLATQLFLQQGEPLCAVVVLHSDPAYAPVNQALSELCAAFADQPTWPPLQTVDLPLVDVLTPAQLEQFSNSLYTTLKSWLARAVRIHLLLAGGRKSMAMLGMSVAQTLLGPDDHLWYLHSDEPLRTSGRHQLTATDQAQLIEIPLPALAPAPPRFTRSFQAATPAAARQALSAEHQRRLQYFLDHELTRAERELALLVAQEVGTVAEIAARLHKAPKTVTNQLNTIYSKLESFFGLQADVGVKREFLRREVGVWLAERLE